MKKFLEIFAWTIAISTGMVILFVKAPSVNGGKSGGDQASKIIETSGGAFSKIIKSLQGS